MSDERSAMPIRLTINGEDRVSNSDPLSPLVDVLRDEFFLTGAKAVCREGFCGACTVLLAGEPIVSCLMPVGLVADREVRTVEALAPEGDLSPLQRALEEHDVVQCGMCFPGLLVTLTRYFEQAEHPNRTDMKAALVGNVCRCTGYERILDAALSLVERAEPR
jgi:aerobic carbon-monoxide dehydrogenase small subunit